MKGIDAVGFDMDYTLAQYNHEFDLLAYNGAVDKLVSMGYPEVLRRLEYEPTRFRRGLVLDKRRGNIIKMDRYKYVRVAYHGSRQLSKSERQAVYRENLDQQPSYTGREYVNCDTLFHLVDAALFEHLVDLKDEYGSDNGFLAGKSYFDIYTDVRHSVDLCHRDGVIKDRVAEDPAKYIIKDPNLFPMLNQFKLAGKKVFLLTNSLFDYTDVVMNYLNEGMGKEGSWKDYFDLVITGSCKPAFLQDPHLSLFRVNTDSYSLTNTDGVTGEASEFLEQGKVFQGGNWLHLHSMLGLTTGERLLYVGDHMYSDILRSKRTLGWRTCLVIPELEQEMGIYRKVHNSDWGRLRQLRQRQNDQDDTVDRLSLQLYQAEIEPQEYEELAERLADELAEQQSVKEQVNEACGAYHRHFHPIWGQIFKAGFMDSRFAKQVLDYACIYTTRASDLGSASPTRDFRAASDLMPHDRILERARRHKEEDEQEASQDRDGAGGEVDGAKEKPGESQEKGAKVASAKDVATSFEV